MTEKRSKELEIEFLKECLTFKSESCNILRRHRKYYVLAGFAIGFGLCGVLVIAELIQLQP